MPLRRRRGCRTAIRAVGGERNALESAAAQGDSPVREPTGRPGGILSRAGHVKPRPNPRGPPRKAKYSRETDSEPVP